MAFALDPKLPLPRALRSVALGELRTALRSLKRGKVRDVHAVRKSVKRLRAWARLLRPALGRDARVLDHLLRDAARALAGSRERSAVRVTLGSFLPKLTAEERHAALRAVLGRFPADTARRRSRALHGAEPLLLAARHYVLHASLAGTQPGRLLKRLEAERKRSRAAGSAARRRPEAARLHEWRKRAKHEAAQRSLLSPLSAGAARDLGALRRLADVLGRHHDLHVLMIALHGARGCATLRSLVAARQAGLEGQALVIGERLASR